MIQALLWKDARLNRLLLVTAAVILIAPYFAPAAVVVVTTPIWEEGPAAAAWGVLLTTGSFFSLMCSQVSLALLGGSAMAAERGDRSAEFLAYLPPSKAQILLSKTILFIGTGAFIWCANLAVALLAAWLAGDPQTAQMFTADLASPWQLATIGVAAGGVGWLASSALESTGPPVALAIAAPFGVLAVLQLSRHALGWPDEGEFAGAYFVTCGIVGAIAFFSGCVYFLRRVEP